MDADPSGSADESARLLADLVAAAQMPDPAPAEGVTARLPEATWGRLAELAAWGRTCGVGAATSTTVVRPPASGGADGDAASRVAAAVRDGVRAAEAGAGDSLAVLRGADLVGARALAAVYLGWDAVRVSGWPKAAGRVMVPADDAWAAGVREVQAALRDASDLHRSSEPAELFTVLGAAEAAWVVAFLLRAAALGLPVVLDGEAAVAAAALARWICPGLVAWWQAADVVEAATGSALLAEVGLTPVLELGVDDPDGTAGLIAADVLRHAVRLADAPD